MDINHSTLIIGHPDSGKTTFQAQLATRIEAGLGRIEQTKAPENFTGLQNACDRLAQGLETNTTPTDENVEVTFHVRLNDLEFDLVCKDYGGEQVRNITNLLEYDKKWIERAQTNDRWILFIRPGQIYHPYDLSTKGYVDLDNAEKTERMADTLSHQYDFIELLQALLHARGTGMKSRIQAPKLLIVLTCWDELACQESPLQVLKDRLPLFHHFVNNLWQKDSHKIIGLSAQGFALDTSEAQLKYREQLPENFGYLVLEDNPKEHDLTRLIEIAIQL